MLEIKNFSFSYDKRKKAVDGLSLTVEAGDICGFIGANGAGKTTTIRALTGVMDFTEGEITIDGHSVKRDPIACKKVTAYVPDNPDLYDFMTGIQYINFICDVYGVGRDERQQSIAKYAGIFELTSALGDLISSYSHGMKQKVALIAALVHNPRLMVFDEPFVGLDPMAQHNVKQIMLEKCQQDGCAVIFSSHGLDVVQKLCNKVAIIRQGKLVTAGETEKVIGDQSLEDVFLELNEHA